MIGWRTALLVGGKELRETLRDRRTMFMMAPSTRPLEQCDRYFAALQRAQIQDEYREFAHFIISSLRARGLQE